MLYEMRTYTAMPGRLPDLHKRFAGITLGFFKKHGIQTVGFWTNEIGGASDQLIYILAYESLADREKKWGAFSADPERLAQFAETEKNGPLVRRLTAQILRPTPYSPIAVTMRAFSRQRSAFSTNNKAKVRSLPEG